MSTDLYELLGVSADATQDEIKKSYRSLARELHPDRNPDNPEAEARFKEITVAYETLRDPERRARYDRYGAGGIDQDLFANVGGMGDIFEAFFGQGSPFGGGMSQTRVRRQGADLEAVVEVPFEEAVLGGERDVTVRTAVPCEACEATGSADHSEAAVCESCGGQGAVRQVRQSILGQMVTSAPCPTCSGTGEMVTNPCRECDGNGRVLEEKTYTVDIPAGVDSGMTLRLSGRGAAGIRSGGYGDLYVKIRVLPHPRLQRAGDDLIDTLHIPMTVAALGGHLKYETLEAVEDLVIPAGTQTGKVFRMRGNGVPDVNGRTRGDLLVQVVVDTPVDLDDRADGLLREFAVARDEEVAPPGKSWLRKIKSAFT